MLYLAPGTSNTQRVHGAFVDDHEVHAVVANWKKRGKPNYIDSILEDQSHIAVPGMKEDKADAGGSGDESDPLYDEAVAFVTESRKASVSAVQRQLRVGYNRAARLVDAMEQAGVLSEAGHNGARKVLAPKPVR
jgi:S-DNA-T family DNA segregation ATPase FtsK/SpoIIIE